MKPPRTTIRNLILVIFGAAILLAWLRTFPDSFQFFAFIVRSSSWLVIATGAGFLGRATGWVIRNAVLRLCLIMMCFNIFGLTAYICWAYFRSVERTNFLSEPFPYPDPAIIALERWFDARHPLRTPGSLKMHGEFPRVWLTLGTLRLIFGTIAGFLLGVVSNRFRGSGRGIRAMDSKI